MSKRQSVSKDKLSNGLLRAAVVSGLTSGLAAAALGGAVPKANATCIGFSGINIGVGCTTLNHPGFHAPSGFCEPAGWLASN